jgi:tetratricopeptide (TPR) repeat protein
LLPVCVIATNNKGAALNILGNYAQAVGYFDKALAINPNFTLALTNKGNSLDGLGRHKEAIALYDKALAINPNFQDALMGKTKCTF